MPRCFQKKNAEKIRSVGGKIARVGERLMRLHYVNPPEKLEYFFHILIKIYKNNQNLIIYE